MKERERKERFGVALKIKMDANELWFDGKKSKANKMFTIADKISDGVNLSKNEIKYIEPYIKMRLMKKLKKVM